MIPKFTYTATEQPSGDVTIVFGKCSNDKTRGIGRFHASNGVQIGSDMRPEWQSSKNKLWIQGTNRDRDDDEVTISAADWPRVRQALVEYEAQLKEVSIMDEQNKTGTVADPVLTYTVNVTPTGDAIIVLGTFTHTREKGQIFRASNGVSLHSDTRPEWYSQSRDLYLQGHSTCRDSDPIYIPADDWPLVRQALHDYKAVCTRVDDQSLLGKLRVTPVSAETKAAMDEMRKAATPAVAELNRPTEPIQTSTERSNEVTTCKPFTVNEYEAYFLLSRAGSTDSSVFYKDHGWTRQRVDELVDELNDLAESKLRANAVRVEQDRLGAKFYIGDRKGTQFCAGVFFNGDYGLNLDQAMKVVDVVAAALSKVLNDEAP